MVRALASEGIEGELEDFSDWKNEVWGRSAHYVT
jgi:hypothetical protein